jgi:hypothetical protein
LTDTVEKGICRNLEATLIQDEEPTRNLDSKIHVAGFVRFKFQFHISFAETFSTVSTQKRHHQPMKEAIGGSSGIALQFFGS